MRFLNPPKSIAIYSISFVLLAASLQGAGRQFLPGHVPEAVASSKSLGPVPADTRISLAVGLPLRNQSELESLLKELVDPSSSQFRHYVTPAQFADRFGPSEEDYQALAAFFQANGLAVTGTHTNRMILDISGTAAEIESTLHIKMMNWNHPVRGNFFAPDREPSLDAGVAILDISGLDNFVLPRPMDLKPRPFVNATPMTTGSGPGGLFNGSDYRAAYAPAVTLNGAGQSVGLFELDGFYAADVQANFQEAGLAPVPVKTVLLDGVSGSPGSANIEVTLDIMMASYMAPGAAEIIVYEGSNPNDVLNRMATDNLASQLSSSWGWSPTSATTEQIFKQMIAQGQSLFQASGDSGAYQGGVMSPSDDPNITVVGGTSLTTSGARGAWQSETAWPESGGGVSTVWPIPSYQQSVNMAAAGGSSTMRNIPDVALIADVQIFLICNNGQWIEVGGTSAAAPLWAGFLALANQQAVANSRPVVGFLNPPIYSIGAGSNYSSDVHDIVVGNNGAFSTLPGYDLVTGWGTPTGQPLINALTATSNAPAFSPSSSPSTLSIAPGASGTSTITINPQQGFSAAVNLSISGLPAGVTALFSPSSATTSSTLSLTAASSAAASTSTLTITGTSGSLTGTARVSLTITAAPSFTLSAAPANLSVAAGKSVSSTIIVTPQGGFQGAVALAASSLPSGVTASFSQNTLTLTASGSAAPGSSMITITGTSGSLQSSVTINLTVGSGFTIAPSSANLSLLPGGSVAMTITVTPQTGFTGTVAFSISGLPTGVTGTFSPASAAKTTSLTLRATASAVLGASTITVTGASGKVSSQATIALTVNAPPSFTLSSNPANLSIISGSSATSTISVTAQNGFNAAVAFSASGLPPGVTAKFAASVVTFTATSTAAAASATVTITGTSGALSSKTSVVLTISKPPSFTLSAAPTVLTVAQGASAISTLTLTPLNGFNSAVTVGLSALPSGVTPSFNASSATTATLTFAASATAAAGKSTVTVTAKAGSLSQTVSIALTIQASSTSSGTSGAVSLASAYNVTGMVTDGAQFLNSSGLDGGGRAYSGTLLATVRTAGGASYNFGPSNAPGAVTGGTIALPSGQYTTLTLLATGVNGSQLGQKFTVTYSDGSTASFTQSLSDWCLPQNFAGESNSIPMTYRDLSNGARDARTVLLYGYTFNLTGTKTVKSITLPANRNVVVLGLSLGPAASSSSAHAVQGQSSIYTFELNSPKR
jgi:Pro-kumamolisin, activation domain